MHLQDDTSGMANICQEIFNSIFNAHAPIKNRMVRTEFAPWNTPEVRKAIAPRDRLKELLLVSLNCDPHIPSREIE